MTPAGRIVGRVFRREHRFAEHIIDDPSAPMWAEHIARYHLAARNPVARGLDIACGSGVGLEVLRRSTDSLVAGDLDARALQEAKSAAGEGVSLCRVDITGLPFPAGTFDRITSFETIEHVPDDRAMVAELRRILARKGVVLVSTPNRLVTGVDDEPPGNPFHLREYTPEELVTLLSTAFSDITLLGQVTTAAYGSSPFWSGARTRTERAALVASKVALRLPSSVRSGLDRVLPRPLFPGPHDFEFRTDRVADAHALLAVCRP